MCSISKSIKRFLLLSVLFLFSFSPVGYCAEQGEMIPKEALTQVLNDWEQSIDTLQTLLSEQKSDLTMAKDELKALKDTLAKQKDQLQILKKDLQTAKQETQTAKESLKKADEELQSIVKDIKKIEAQKHRAENQRNLWEVIAGILGVVAITK